MHLLITNDDGVSSVGLKALADAAMRRGHRVFISAPNGQRSANSQHITLTAPIIASAGLGRGGGLRRGRHALGLRAGSPVPGQRAL